jgi:hypothetical protein
VIRWFRTNRRRSAHLALFALALQFYLSFGHIHAEDLGLAPAAKVIAQTASAQHGGSTPADNDDHDVCAICVALSLTASSVVPIVAPLQVPVATDWAWLNELESPRLVVALPANFQARAPPHV